VARLIVDRRDNIPAAGEEYGWKPRHISLRSTYKLDMEW